MDCVELYRKIEEVINSKPKKYTKEEAREILVSCGIIDKDDNITEPFRDIIVKKEEDNYQCSCYHERTESHRMTDFEKGVYFAKNGKLPDNDYYDVTYGVCWGTFEQEHCDCAGDTRFCTHYPEKRKK